MKRVSIIILLMCYVSTIFPQDVDTSGYRLLDAYDFHLQYIISDSSVLLDVREPLEFRKMRIKDAINIVSMVDLERFSDTTSSRTPIFIYCTTDSRSIISAEQLVKSGFTKVFVLKEGISGWRRDKFPLDKHRVGEKRGESSERVDY